MGEENVSNKKKRHVCPICGKTYGSKGFLSMHVKRAHKMTLDDAIKNQESQPQPPSQLPSQPQPQFQSQPQPQPQPQAMEQEQNSNQLFSMINQVLQQHQQQFDLQQQQHQTQQTEVKEKSIEEITEKDEIKFITFLPEYITARVVLRVGGVLETRRALAIGSYKGIPTLLGLDSSGRFLPPTFFANFVGLEGSTRVKQAETQIPKQKQRKGLKLFSRKKKKQPLKVIDFGDILKYE